MSMMASDFSFLPDIRVPGERAPLVSVKVIYCVKALIFGIQNGWKMLVFCTIYVFFFTLAIIFAPYFLTVMYYTRLCESQELQILFMPWSTVQREHLEPTFRCPENLCSFQSIQMSEPQTLKVIVFSFICNFSLLQC